MENICQQPFTTSWLIQVKMMNLMIRPQHLSEKKVKNKVGEGKKDGLCRAEKEDKG